MEVFKELLLPGNVGLASTIILYSFVIAAGILLGKIKFGGVSLGVTFVLFVGILLGQFGYTADANVIKFLREFGLILFIFAIGLQVGPAFFSSFKEGGVRLNILAVLGVALNVAIVLAIYYLTGDDMTMDQLVGVMSGAVTNTPGLAAAQQTVNTPEAVDTMARGYAAAYPLGVVGIILAMFIIKWAFRIKVDDEIAAINKDREESQLKPYITSFEVNNERLDGMTLLKLHDVITCNFVVSRLMGADGKIEIPTSQTTIHNGDKLLLVISSQDLPKFVAVLGNEIEMDWDAVTPSEVVSRRILITKSEYNGVDARLASSAQRLPSERNSRQPCGCRPARIAGSASADGRPHHRGGPARRHRTPRNPSGQLDEASQPA